MSKNILAMVKAATGELGFVQPVEVMSSSELLVIQLRSLCVAASDELLDCFDWQALLKRYTFTTTNNVSLYQLPADFHRMVSLTPYSVSDQWALNGNTSAPEWEQTLTVSGSASVLPTFRIIGNQIEVYPTPGTGSKTFAFHYISNWYVIDGSSGLNKPEFSGDGDSTVFHNRLLTNFIKLKLLQIKKLDTEAATQDYSASLTAAIDNDTPAPMLSTDRGNNFIYDNDYRYDVKVV